MCHKQNQEKRQYKVIMCNYSTVRCAVGIEYQVQVMIRIL